MLRSHWLLAISLSISFEPAVLAQPTATHGELAAELLRVMKIERDIAIARDLMIELQVKTNPQLAPYRDVMQEWMSSVMSWENLSPRVIPLYTNAFDESQMKAMIAFFGSPAGQRAVDELPALMQKLQELGTQLAQEHVSELRRMLDGRRAELERAEEGERAEEQGQLQGDYEAAQATIRTLRRVGTAMFSWATDAIASPEYRSAGASSGAADVTEGDLLSWGRCPAISHDELQSLLVPEYILELPKQDGWGRDLEFCLNRADLMAVRLTLGVRSPGRDGRFQEGAYRPNTFGADDPDRDIVWLDGYFVVAPGAQP